MTHYRSSICRQSRFIQYTLAPVPWQRLEKPCQADGGQGHCQEIHSYFSLNTTGRSKYSRCQSSGINSHWFLTLFVLHKSHLNHQKGVYFYHKMAIFWEEVIKISFFLVDGSFKAASLSVKSSNRVRRTADSTPKPFKQPRSSVWTSQCCCSSSSQTSTTSDPQRQRQTVVFNHNFPCYPRSSPRNCH